MNSPTPEAAAPSSSSLAHTVLAVYGHVDRASPGDRAELRRLQPGRLEPPAFWRIVAGPLSDVLVGSDSQARLSTGRHPQEERWALLVGAMARSGMAHDRKRGLGRALAEAGVSELRFMKLLRADARQLPAQVFSIAQLLAAKAEPVNWVDLAFLVLSCGRSDSQKSRRRVARDYFSAASH